MKTNPNHWFHLENPLLRNLPNWSSIREIAARLRNDPLDGLDVAALSPIERHELLMGDKMPLHPTRRSLQCAMSIMGMHRCSLRARNPAIADGRRSVEKVIAAATSKVDFLRAPPMPGASLLVLKGMSGTAKSATAKLTLMRLLGSQVIRHGREPESLFVEATQINWLFVSMSHDGSRGGLLTAILLQIDQALGTTHATDLRRTFRSIESLAGAVIALLHTYYTGVLVIDEMQLLNIVENQHAELMQLFLLSLANSGIPLVLIGNPFGFTWLSQHSQNLTRLLERPQFFFHPCGALDDDDEWPSVSTGVVKYYLLEDPAQDLDQCKAALRLRSGGIARLALALWCNAQASALFDGRRSINASDVDAAYADDSFELARPLVDGFALRDPSLLLPWRYVDIPVDLYAKHWGKPLDTPSAPSVPGTPTAPTAAKRRSTSAAAKLKAAETRESNRQRERDRLANSLTVDDMRMEGLKQHGLASLDDLMRQIQLDGANPTGPQA